MVQVASGVMGDFLWHTLAPIEHNLSIVADHVHPFIATVCTFSDGRTAHHVTDWFLQRDNVFTGLQRSPQSPDLNPIEHLRGMLLKVGGEELRLF